MKNKSLRLDIIVTLLFVLVFGIGCFLSLKNFQNEYDENLTCFNYDRAISNKENQGDKQYLKMLFEFEKDKIKKVTFYDVYDLSKVDEQKFVGDNCETARDCLNNYKEVMLDLYSKDLSNCNSNIENNVTTISCDMTQNALEQYGYASKKEIKKMIEKKTEYKCE